MSTLVLSALFALLSFWEALATRPNRFEPNEDAEVQPPRHPALNTRFSQFQVYAAMRCNDAVVAASSPGNRSQYPKLSALMQQQPVSPDKRPVIAVCVIGKARTFAHMLAHETLKRHLIDSFGARETYLYFHLATKDSRGDQSQSNGGTLKVDLQEQVEAAHYVAELEPPAYDGALTGKRTQYDYPKAEIIIDDRDDQEITNDNLKLRNMTGNCENSKDFYATPKGHSAVNQLVGYKQCSDFVDRRETLHEMKFDFVFKTRPDITYRDPILPYCLHKHAAGSGTTVHRHDWLFLIPRPHVPSVGRMFNSWAECSEDERLKKINVEDWIFSTLGSNISMKSEKTQHWLGAPMILRPNHSHFPTNVCLEDPMFVGSAAPPYDQETCITNTVGSVFNTLTAGEGISDSKQ